MSPACLLRLVTTLLVMCVLLATVSSATLDEEDYVEAISNSHSGRSEMRKVSSRHKRAAVKDVTKNKLVQSDRKLFLKTHNVRRSEVNPTASNMLFMTWNMSLEAMAQAWAAKCEFEHGQVRTIDGAIQADLGQNLWVGTGGYNVEGGVIAWDNERKDYDFSSLTCAKGKVCGHYTQVAWAETAEVGCGIQYCPKMKSFQDQSYIIVCNYYKPGNYRGVKNYKEGASCSQCPANHKCDTSLKLCRRDPQCSGTPDCANGGTKDKADCMCSCKEDDGYGAYCKEFSLPSAASSVVSGLLINVVCVILSRFGM